MSANEIVSYYSGKEETLKKDEFIHSLYREKEVMTPAK